MSVTPFPSKKMTPEQALLHAQKDSEDMEYVAIAYILKGEDHPRLTCSSMQPIDVHFLGTAVQNYAMKDWDG